MRDISDRKRAEEALRASEEKARALLNAITETAVLVDIDGTILACNEVAAQRLGGTMESLSGLCLWDLFDQPVAQTRKAAAEDVIRTDHPVRMTDERNGRIFDCHYYPIFDAQGTVGQLAIFALDITERRRLEEELLKHQKLESLGVLAGGIAHDFNNILTAVMGNLSLAKTNMESGDPECLALLNEAEKATLNARSLTRQLMTFSKGDSPVREATSISEMIRQSCDFALRGSAVRCTYAIPSDLWAAEIDVGQINQVIHNTVLNAVQAMPQGGVITVRAENTKVKRSDDLPLKPGKYIRLSFQDQGEGIPQEHLSKIFDPYFSTKTKGTGLGLTISYSILKKHDGHIMVTSQPKVGTTFHMYLPASREKPAILSSSTAEPTRGKGRVLVVDDEEAVRNVIHLMLESLGYEVECAEEGGRAIECYVLAMKSGNPFQVVIMDLTIPGGMGGKEAVQKLQAIDPEVKAVVSSGYSTDAVMSHYKDAGFHAVLRKPYQIEELGAVLAQVIGSREPPLNPD